MKETYEGEPPESMRHKERGSTTLKQCGWCEHASGSHRFGYCISGKCQLQKSYSADVKWSDECAFKAASKSDIQAMVDSHDYSIESSVQSIKNHQRYIKILTEIMKKAGKRPPLPDDRKAEHFNDGDEIAVFYKDEWRFGEVKIGYRHHDGCVSYRLDGVGPQESGFWGSGMAVPTVMLKSEWQFFRDNPEQYDLWSKKAYDKSFNGERIGVARI